MVEFHIPHLPTLILYVKLGKRSNIGKDIHKGTLGKGGSQ
jgi:hypothetical protein